eukprot:scaffold301_cov243-Pinguiococcus_pyrenoidosus.AAC.133
MACCCCSELLRRATRDDVPGIFRRTSQRNASRPGLAGTRVLCARPPCDRRGCPFHVQPGPRPRTSIRCSRRSPLDSPRHDTC